ncbi:MAG: hypothetical protein MUF54_08035 [Polyangiaceae bacterium]|jgi:hypothetical protein|nr:hypothetical protein [Polyangiaceae bacterium]
MTRTMNQTLGILVRLGREPGGRRGRSAARFLAVVSALGVAGAASLGCDEDFDPKSEIKTVRVIGVRADNPYPKPGDTVQFSMLWHDGGSPPDSPQPMQFLWIGGCFNPPGDLYYQCFPQLGELFQQAAIDPPSVKDLIGFGETFSLQVPQDLISRRPQANGVDPYGLSYVFFALCAGELRPAEPGEDGLPIGCFGPDGTRLGADRFVPGYFSLYSFENRTNTNPVLLGLSINGVAIAPGDEPSLPRCRQDCPEFEIRALVDPASVEVAEGLTGPDGETLLEQMWVEYATTGGELERATRLVNDATKGFNEENEATFKPPSEPGKVYVFAVVRDNRGGASWVKQGLLIE